MSIDQNANELAPDQELPAEPPEPRLGWAGVRPLLLRLHFYAGVFIGPFLLVAAVTGLAYVWAPQAEQAVYDHELHVPAAATTVPLDQQTAAAKALVPDGTLTGVRPGPAPTDTTQVIFTRPGLEPSFHWTVFVDPHTGDVRGQLETYGSGQAMPLRGWIDVLHRSLHLGDFGRLYSELAASWLWVVVLAGLALWFGRVRRKRAAAASPRAKLLTWHGRTGLILAIGLLFLSATGLTWSEYAGNSITELRTQLDWTTPSVSAAVPETSGRDIGFDGAREATLRAGLTGPVEVRPPAGPGKGYVVAQLGRSWPVQADSMAVDPATGRITDTLRFADYNLAAKLSTWGIDAHMGFLFGIWNQIVLTLLAVALICVIGWGYRMWWLRRPTRGDARAGRPPARATWRKIPGRALAPALAVVAVVGYYLPLFGLSLLGFLIVDGVLEARRRKVAA